MTAAPAPSPFQECEHARVTKPRARAVRGGSVQYRRQCLDCGAPVGNPISKEAVLAETRGVDPRQFDEALFTLKEEERELLYRNHLDQASAAWWIWYNEYLSSPEWQARRIKVFSRRQNTCEGCGDREATQVHHLTYAHVGAEFLFELVGLCAACHDLSHSGSPNKPPAGVSL